METLHSESRIKAIASLIAAQKDMQNPARDGKGNYGKYTTLAAALGVIDTLNEHGFAVMQDISGEEITDSQGIVLFVASVKTYFYHYAGYVFEFGPARSPVAKQDPQGVGSSITYLRRYAIMAACGLAPEDDDGQAGSSRAPVERATPPRGEDTGPRAMKAKISTTCPDCGQRIGIGDDILYTKGEPAIHAECPVGQSR